MHARALPLALLLALVAAATAPLAAQAATSGPKPPAMTEVAFITAGSASSPTLWQAFDSNTRAVYDFNKDGKPALVLSNDNLRHYVIDPRTGAVLSEIRTAEPYGQNWGGRELDSVAVGDVMGNGGSEIAIENGEAQLTLLRFDTANSTPTSFQFAKLWDAWTNAKLWDPNFASTHPYNANGSPTSEGHPFLASVDGTGVESVFSNAQDVSTAVSYAANGTQLWFNDPPVDLNAGVAIADLRGDGKQEAILASDHGPLYVEDASSGKMLWTFDTRCTGGVWQGDGSNCDWSIPGSISVTPLISDLYGDGKKEICFGSRWTVAENDTGWYGNSSAIDANVNASHAQIFCVGPDGKQLWHDQLPWFNPHLDVAPVPFDVNGDGARDLIFIDWNTIGHKPGNFQTTARGPNMFALDGRTGDVLWNVTLNSGWSNKGLALADLFGDGRQDIIAEEFGPTGDDGLGVFDPHTGQRLAWYPLQHGWGATRGPIVADLNGDGYMEIIVPLSRTHQPQDDGYCPQKRADLACREGAIEILAPHKQFSSQFTDSFTWDQKGDAHLYDPAPHTEPPSGPPTAWPNEAAAPTVMPYTINGPIPMPPPTSVPVITSPKPATQANDSSQTSNATTKLDPTATTNRSVSPSTPPAPTQEALAPGKSVQAHAVPAFAASTIAIVAATAALVMRRRPR